MPLINTSEDNIKFDSPDFLLLDNFKRGVVDLINEANIPKNALARLVNMFLIENGQPATRWGCDWYGAVSPNEAAIDGFDYFDFNGTIHLVMVAGGTVYRSTNDGTTWTACTGGTLTAGNYVDMNQNGNYLSLTTGVDNILRYDGSTVLLAYNSLTTPTAPTAATTPAVPGTTYTYYYKTSAVNQIGFSLASTAVTVQHGVPRTSWDATTNYVTFTLPAYQSGQTRVDIYFSEDNVTFYYLDSVVSPNLTYKDAGAAQVVPSTLAPTGNTTQGPKVKILRNVGSRQYGVKDADNRYRIWFTGTGSFSGAFSTAYDGGYLDWQPGGKFYPSYVADYQDAKANPVATIWCDSADGQGCVLHMSLSTLSIGTVNITVPSAYKVPGTRGTPAPYSVINVLNDYFFYNSQAVYNYGPRQQFANFLSTDEGSANIRNSVQRINRTAESGITGIYHGAHILLSVPIDDSTTNNQTMLYNTELKGWVPEAFDIGFSRFMKYTDTTRTQHLLALKPGDNRLTEISRDYLGDYGQPFETHLVTGLNQTMRNPFEFQYVEEMEVELSSLQGTVYAELLGVDMKAGFRSQKILPITVPSTVILNGWDTYVPDDEAWDSSGVVTAVASEVSTPRYGTVQRDMKSAQWHLYTNDLESTYIFRRAQTWGTATQGGHPSSWRIRSI